jgi:hypothetical protein
MLPNLVSDRSRLPWLECLAAREDEVTATKKGGSGLLLKQFRLSDILQHCVIVFCPMIDHADFSVVVRNRATPPKQWCWEIYRAGRKSPIERSKAFFKTMAEANRAGKVALGLLLSEYPG